MTQLLALLVLVFCFCLGPVLSYCSLHFAWGMEVKSWPAFFIVWVVGIINLSVTTLAVAALGKK